MSCCIKDCHKPLHAGGMCGMHYRRYVKYGDPTVVKQPQYHGLPLVERLMKRVEKTDYCWLWTGSKDQKGYGRLNVGGIPLLVHRVLYQQLMGVTLTRKQFVCHKCDNPICCNPAHLFVGNQQANMDDKMSKGRHRYGVSKGESHGMAKITPDIVRAIRASSETGVVLALRFNLSKTHVSDIRNYKTWKHLGDTYG